MTIHQERDIIRLHDEGKTSKEIAAITGVKSATVRSFLSRKKNGIHMAVKSDDRVYCENCHKVIPEKRYKRHRRFCSDLCRSKWWNANRDKLRNADVHTKECCICGKTFFSYTPAKYCSRACYFTARKETEMHHE